MSSDLYLFRFGYSTPAAIRRAEQYPHEDLDESSEMLFIRAGSDTEVPAIGAAVAEEFGRRLFGSTYSWRALNFAHWIETDHSVVEYALSHGAMVLESPSEIATLVEELVRRRPPG